ncbi:MAG: TM2 domain-containing protein [Clostridia bacterium]|nr:TM2 domain-containing protein [Clostridia bacterium]
MALGPRKSKTVALILCIIGFFGFGGLHRMYVGKVGSGVLHFLTYGLCVIGTIIDLISIIAGSFTDSYGQPLV